MLEKQKKSIISVFGLFPKSQKFPPLIVVDLVVIVKYYTVPTARGADVEVSHSNAILDASNLLNKLVSTNIYEPATRTYTDRTYKRI